MNFHSFFRFFLQYFCIIKIFNLYLHYNHFSKADIYPFLRVTVSEAYI